MLPGTKHCSIIVAGATGAIGRDVIVRAVASDRITRIVALSRSLINMEDRNRIIDLFPGIDYEKAFKKVTFASINWEEACCMVNNQSSDSWNMETHFSNHHIVINAMGTTLKDENYSKEAFYRCDFDYTMSFFKLAYRYNAQMGLSKLIHISSAGANPSSLFFYLRTKGCIDKCIVDYFRDKRVGELYIYRPGVLDRNSKSRFKEKFINFFIKGVKTDSIAESIVAKALHEATNDTLCTRYIYNKDI